MLTPMPPVAAVVALCLGVVLAIAPAPAPDAIPASSPPPRVAPVAAVRYHAPVAPITVTRGFQPPPSPYAAGHRGIDLAVNPGQSVRAAASGTVTFAGNVAGRGVVVITHADGIRTEYEPVRPSVFAGAQVLAGQQIAVVDGAHGSCAPSSCMHWGARRGTVYLDPLRLLTPLGPVRLLPESQAQARGCACRYTARSRSTETWV